MTKTLHKLWHMTHDDWRDYEDLVCYAMRYCIGRHTYSVGFMCDYYSARINEWSNKSLINAIKDIDSAYSLGDKRIDEPYWLKLRGMIYEELKERKVIYDELDNIVLDIPARCPHEEMV